MIVMMLSLGASEGLRYITDRLLGPPDAAFGPGAARRRWPPAAGAGPCVLRRRTDTVPPVPVT